MAQQFVQAATEIVRLAEDVSPRDVVVTASAMFLMQTMAGHMFRSEAAFDIQLARRVRGLTASNATAYRDPKTGKARRIYHELSPRAAATMSEWLRMNGVMVVEIDIEASFLTILHGVTHPVAARRRSRRWSRSSAPYQAPTGNRRRGPLTTETYRSGRHWGSTGGGRSGMA
jgi:hypothetical protein